MKQMLDLLIQIGHGIAAEFGSSCEVVVHDLTKQEIESSVAYIENGHVSSRVVGDGPSEVVLETMQKDPSKIKDHLAYLTRTSDGRILKSTTMYIRGSDGRIDYILSLNYDITGLITIDNALKSLIDVGSSESRKPKEITHNVGELLDSLIEQSVELVGKPVALMSKEDKIEAIHFLNDAGAFLITKSGDKVSSFFGISKFTLYSYMDASKNGEKS